MDAAYDVNLPTNHRQISREHELSNPQALLYGVINSIPDLIYFKNPEGIYLGCNKAFEKYFGMAESNIAGRTDFDFMDEGAAESLCRQEQKILEHGKAQTNEEWVSYPDGSKVCLQTVKTPYFSVDGELLGLVGIGRDITGRKHLEEELYLSALAYRHCSESMMVSNADNCIVAVNPAFTRTTGYSEAEVLGRDPRMLQSGLQDQDFFREMWRKIRDAGHWQGEIWNRRKNGEIFPEWLTIDTVYAGNGSVHQYVALFSDITEKKLIEGALSESESRFRNIFEYAPIGMAVTSLDGHFIQVNQTFCDILGYRKAELKRLGYADITFPDDLKPSLDKVRKLLDGKQNSIRLEKRYLHKQGKLIWVRISTSVHRDGDGAPLFFITQVENISEHKFVEEKMLQEKKFSEDIINTLPDIFCILDTHGRFIRINQPFVRITGHPEEELRHMTVLDLFEEDSALFAERMTAAFREGRLNVEARLTTKDGRKIPYYFSGQRTEIYGKACLVGLGRDISERKAQEELLASQANIDFLTGLPNRRYFLELSERELMRAQRNGSQTSLIMLDLDEFKSINDNHGHHIGDRALESLGTVCKQLLREADIIGRMGGEEFAILLPETSCRQALDIAERLRQGIEQAEIELEDGGVLHFTASLGVDTLAAADGMDIDRLLNGADHALYEAKRGGRNRVCNTESKVN